MSPKRTTSREVISSEGSDKTKDRSPSPGGTWTMEQHGKHTPDTTSDNAKTLAFLNAAQQHSKQIFKAADSMLNTLDGVANEGHFPKFFSEHKDKIEKWLNDLKKSNRVALEQYFYHMVQGRFGRDAVWEPLKDLTEQVISGRDIGGDSTSMVSTPTGERLHSSDHSESAISRLMDLPSPPTISSNRDEGLNRMLSQMKLRMESGDYNSEDIKSVIMMARLNKPENFEYIDRTIQAKLSSDTSWQPMKDLVEQVKHDYVDTIVLSIEECVDYYANRGETVNTDDKDTIRRHITQLQKNDPKGFKYLDDMIQEKLRINEKWEPIKRIIDSVKADSALNM